MKVNKRILCAFFLIILCSLSISGITAKNVKVLINGQEQIFSNYVSQTSIVKVHFIDVGQADSIYIQVPDGYDILIDGGNNADGNTVVNYLKAQGLDDIELMVATHAHEDHIGGLDDVLEAFVVEHVIDSGQKVQSRTYTDYWTAVEAEKGRYQEDCDLSSEIGDKIIFEVIETGDGYENTNNNSVLTKLTYNDVSFLFTGDMESDVEEKILNRDIQADVLKVGHHGSRSSTSESFLEKVNPKWAVISCGQGNSYGHPHQEVVDRLLNYGCDLYSTVEGTVVVSTDGDTVTLAY